MSSRTRQSQKAAERQQRAQQEQQAAIVGLVTEVAKDIYSRQIIRFDVGGDLDYKSIALAAINAARDFVITLQNYQPPAPPAPAPAPVDANGTPVTE